MSREAVGDYMNISWNDEDSPIEYVRGHVTLEQAREALNRWQAGWGEHAHAVDHQWARWIPVRNQDWDRELNLVEVPGRGAFAVTQVTVNGTAREFS